VGHRDQPDLAVRELRREVVHVELAGLGHPRDAQLDPVRIAQHLPGHQVRMVLHLGDHHGLARLHHAAAVAVRAEVDRFGAGLGEDDSRRSPAFRNRDTASRAAS
jgi:hypothetical protein